jgi:hypothetical protein
MCIKTSILPIDYDNKTIWVVLEKSGDMIRANRNLREMPLLWGSEESQQIQNSKFFIFIFKEIWSKISFHALMRIDKGKKFIKMRNSCLKIQEQSKFRVKYTNFIRFTKKEEAH